MERNTPSPLVERWAVFATHGTSQGTKCWLCSEPLNFCAMEVDHVLPEWLLDDQATLTEALIAFGLPQNFDLNSFENWLPAHRHCNLQKLNHVFRPTPLIQRRLDRAHAKADDARQKCNATATERQIERAIGILATGGTALLSELLDLIVQNYAAANSEPVIVGERISPPFGQREPIHNYGPPNEVRLGPNLTITFDRNPRPDANGTVHIQDRHVRNHCRFPVLDATVMKMR